MTDPLRGARPVGPSAPPPTSNVPPGGPANRGQGPGGQGPGGQGPYHSTSSTYVRTFTWQSSRRGFPWFAILLVVLGVGLLVEMLVPELTFGSLIILALGIAFGAAWLFGRVVGATVPSLVLLAWALSRMATELGYLSGDGWSSLSVGVAFLIGWGLGPYQKTRRQWALVLGLIFGVIGLADVSDALPISLDVAILVPLALIGVGVYLIVRSRYPSARV